MNAKDVEELEEIKRKLKGVIWKATWTFMAMLAITSLTALVVLMKVFSL